MNLVRSVLILAIAGSLPAQTKLAVVNMNSALIATKDGQKAASELNARRAAKSKEFEQKQTEIFALQDQLTKGANS